MTVITDADEVRQAYDASRNLRILCLQPFLEAPPLKPAAGGKAVVGYQLARWMASQGHSVGILPWGERLAEERRADFGDGLSARVFPTRFPGDPMAWLWDALGNGGGWWRKGMRWLPSRLIQLRSLRKALRLFHPDVIHVQYTRSTFPDVAKRLSVRIPMVLSHYHGIGNGIDVYSAVIFPTRFQMEERAIGIRRGLMQKVVYVPLDFAFLRRGFVPFPARRKSILFVGEMTDDRKGLDLLIAAYRLRPALNAFPLEVVGDGARRAGFEASAAGLNIRFRGAMPTEEIAGLMGNSFLLAVPSRWESFGLVYAESLCCGTPVLGYPPTLRELGAELGESIGIAFDAKSQGPADLAGAILSLLESVAGREAALRGVQAKAQEMFRPEMAGKSVLEIYRAVLGT